MSKLKLFGLAVVTMLISTVASSTVYAGIKDNSWVDTNMIKVIENTVPLKPVELSSSTDKPGYWCMTEKSNNYVVPIELNHSGQLVITVKAENLTTGIINCGLYSDVRLTNEVGNTPSLTRDNNEIVGKYVLNKGTYYLALEKNGSSKGLSIKGIINAIIIRSDNRTIKLGKTYYGYFERDFSEIEYKVNTPNQGYIKLKATKDMIIKIYDADKNDISNSIKLDDKNGYLTIIPVNKDTYYIKLSGNKGEFAIATQFNSVDGTSDIIEVGTNKFIVITGKALTSKKIRLVLRKDTKIKLNAYWLGGWGHVDICIDYTGDTKLYFNDFFLNSSKPKSSIKLAGEKEWPTGTYYITVNKGSELSSAILCIEVEKIN